MKNNMFLFVFLFSTSVLFSQVTFKGTVYGADSKPIPYGIVAFAKGDYSEYSESKSFSDGKFEIVYKNFSDSYNCYLIVCAPFHAPTYFFLPINSDKVIEVEVKLQALMLQSDSVKIISELDSFHFDKSKLMTKNNDGTYSYEFNTSKKKLTYQILYSYYSKPLRSYYSNASMRSSNGTMGEITEDMNGDFFSTVPVENGKVTVVFDPSKLIKPSDSYSKILNEPLNLRFELYLEYSKLQNEYGEKQFVFSDSLNSNVVFNYDISKWDRFITSKIAKPYSKNMKLLYDVYYIKSKRMYDSDSILKNSYNSSIAQNFFEDIPYSNYLWTYNGEIFTDVLNIVFQDSAEEKFKEVIRFCKERKDNDLKFSIYFTFLNEVFTTKSPIFREVYDKALSDLAGYENLHILKYQFNPDRKIKVGNPIPEFEIVSIDSSHRIISKTSLNGNYYLIDFWATWSQTSLTEMPKLHKIFDKFNEKKGFTIVSLSFDDKLENVKEFRQKYKYSMPWNHGFVEKGFNHKLAELFEVGSIPKRILVDQVGNIVALNDDLRGSNLEKTLIKFLE